MAMTLQERMVRLARIGNVLIVITSGRVICSNLSKEQGVVKHSPQRQALNRAVLDVIVSRDRLLVAEPCR